MSIVLTAQAQCNTPSNAVISRLLCVCVCAWARATHTHGADAQRNIAYIRAQLNAPSINRPSVRPPTKREYYEWHSNRCVYNADWRPTDPFECISFLWWVFFYHFFSSCCDNKNECGGDGCRDGRAPTLSLASSITLRCYRCSQICLLVTHSIAAPLEWNRTCVWMLRDPSAEIWLYLLLLLFCVEKQYGEFSHCFMGFAVCLV